jgi:hypothetical protein
MGAIESINSIFNNIDIKAQENAYNLIVFLLFSVIGFILFIFFSSKSIFSHKFGNSIFFNLILLFVVFIIWILYYVLKKGNITSNFTDLLYKTFGNTKSDIFLVSLVLIILGLFFTILYTLGIFSKEKADGATLLINYAMILFMIGGTAALYKKMNIETPDKEIITRGFIKYIILFVLYIFLIFGLYLYNPYDIMTKYSSSAIFISMFMGFAIIFMLVVYGYFADPNNLTELKKELNQGGISKFSNILFKGLWVSIALLVSAGFFYWLIKSLGFLNESSDNNKEYITTIVNLILIIGVFAIIYKVVIASGFDTKIPLFNLIYQTILYIPCLLVVLFDFIAGFFRKGSNIPGVTPSSPSATPGILQGTTKNDLIFLGISVSLCGLYLLLNYVILPYINRKYYKQGGQQLVNQPIRTDVLTNVATYEDLNGENKFNYNYAISFWFYIDSFSSNTGYEKMVPILSYGDNPSIKYYAPKNMLIITTKQPSDNEDIIDKIQGLEKNIKIENIEKWNSIQSEIKSGIEYVKTLPIPNDLDVNGNRIIYKRSDILLQKWNNIVLNYRGGTLDIFYNGKLVKSAIEVVPKLSYDMLTVGSENGISGNISNLLYFKEPLDILTINQLYVSLKDTNPPAISHINQTLIPLPNQY